MASTSKSLTENHWRRETREESSTAVVNFEFHDHLAMGHPCLHGDLDDFGDIEVGLGWDGAPRVSESTSLLFDFSGHRHPLSPTQTCNAVESESSVDVAHHLVNGPVHGIVEADFEGPGSSREDKAGPAGASRSVHLNSNELGVLGSVAELETSLVVHPQNGLAEADHDSQTEYQFQHSEKD